LRWVFLDGCRITNGATAVALPSGRVAVLAGVLLLNHGHPVPKDRLREILWPDETCDNARARISTTVWRLRKQIEKAGGASDAIRVDRDFVTYACKKTKSDAQDLGRMAHLVSRRKEPGLADDLREHMEACIAQYHSDFLPQADDHWTLLTREALRSSVLLLIEALIEDMRQRGRWGRVTELASRMLKIDPSLERGYQQLIDLHGARNDLAAAERQYDLCSRVLKDTLDVTPAPETAAAISALKIARRQAPTASGRSARSPLLQAPSLERVEEALDHLETARAMLRGS